MAKEMHVEGKWLASGLFFESREEQEIEAILLTPCLVCSIHRLYLLPVGKGITKSLLALLHSEFLARRVGGAVCWRKKVCFRGSFASDLTQTCMPFSVFIFPAVCFYSLLLFFPPMLQKIKIAVFLCWACLAPFAGFLVWRPVPLQADTRILFYKCC